MSALARLHDESGAETLVSLAAESSVRLTVLAYAQELGLLDQIDAAYRSDEARAEAELVRVLSEPSHFGYPPSKCELLDVRKLCWPSYDEPVDCYLFKFSYTFPNGEYTNVGIAGPATHAFGNDLSILAPSEIYAAFAGWQAEHEEIQELEIDPANPHQATEVERYTRRLSDQGFTEIEPSFIGLFFGERSLIARVKFEGRPGFGVVSDAEIHWIPQVDSNRGLSAEVAYAIYKGKRLLRTFNQDFGLDAESEGDTVS